MEIKISITKFYLPIPSGSMKLMLFRRVIHYLPHLLRYFAKASLDGL